MGWVECLLTVVCGGGGGKGIEAILLGILDVVIGKGFVFIMYCIIGCFLVVFCSL